jgi:hypothetical protein
MDFDALIDLDHYPIDTLGGENGQLAHALHHRNINFGS